MTTKRFAVAFGFLILFVNSADAQVETASGGARDGVKSNMDRLSVVRAVFQSVTDNDPPTEVAKLAKDRGHEMPPRRTFEDHEWLHSKGNLRHETQISPERNGGKSVSKLRVVTNGGRLDELVISEFDGKKAYGCGIAQLKRHPEESTIDLALGLRLHRETSWITAGSVDQWKQIKIDQDEVVFEASGSTGIRYLLSYRPSLGYALARVEIKYPPGGGREVIENSEFQMVGGSQLPFKIVRYNEYQDSAGKMWRPITRTLTVKKYELPEKQASDETFLVTWPADQTVYDARISTVLEIGDKPSTLTDPEIQRQLLTLQQENDAALREARERVDRNR